MYAALQTQYGVPEEGLKFFTIHINGVEEDHYDVIKRRLVERAPGQGRLIESEAKYAISQSAKFWRALYELKDATGET